MNHTSLPQMRAMYKGDHSRKMHLVDYGFRLPSAYDNRPLMFEEFEEYINSAIFVSATPGEYEKEHSGQIVEQLVRFTDDLWTHRCRCAQVLVRWMHL